MIHTKRKDQPINPIDIQPHSKKIRHEKIITAKKKKEIKQ
jgi:hypothetical protein